MENNNKSADKNAEIKEKEVNQKVLEMQQEKLSKEQEQFELKQKRASIIKDMIFDDSDYDFKNEESNIKLEDSKSKNEGEDEGNSESKKSKEDDSSNKKSLKTPEIVYKNSKEKKEVSNNTIKKEQKEQEGQTEVKGQKQEDEQLVDDELDSSEFDYKTEEGKHDNRNDWAKIKNKAKEYKNNFLQEREKTKNFEKEILELKQELEAQKQKSEEFNQKADFYKQLDEITKIEINPYSKKQFQADRESTKNKLIGIIKGYQDYRDQAEDIANNLLETNNLEESDYFLDNHISLSSLKQRLAMNVEDYHLNKEKLNEISDFTEKGKKAREALLSEIAKKKEVALSFALDKKNKLWDKTIEDFKSDNLGKKVFEGEKQEQASSIFNAYGDTISQWITSIENGNPITDEESVESVVQVFSDAARYKLLRDQLEEVQNELQEIKQKRNNTFSQTGNTPIGKSSSPQVKKDPEKKDIRSIAEIYDL